ncbi:hypothetical protein [Desulfovibrio intestinalis]|uniref:Uncharacterized protein n=1 Tax=Desulfovibrio intestinalis TaxID=58621 RepID=A0A7W8C2Q2_9BACT|nr:hypothetical protein [Desulfovibrio intestinalis]MBB5143773.1 hypothetical protein [Desulfovibrio intestinalis]
MHLLNTVSLLTPDGYFYKAENCHGGLLPGSAVNIAPPKLKPYESARINEAKNDWIIEEDLNGLHAPAFDFNEVDQESFIFDDRFYTHIPDVKYSLATLRALSRHAVHRVRTKNGDRFFNFRGMETQNRLIYLNNNLNIIAKETVAAYNFLYNSTGVPCDNYLNILSKTKFGIEQSIYCMKLSFDYLIQIASYFLFKKRKLDSLGAFLKLLGKNNDNALKVKELIFSRYTDKNFNFLKFLNGIANCYKHSYLQAFADCLHGKGVPSVITVHLEKNDVITVSNGQYLQLIYGFHVSMAESMSSIKDTLSEDIRCYFEQRENDPMGFI